jgi:H+/Cl- antiporter ClcA
MALQLEQAKINVKETTPILTIVRPVMVPFIPSSTSSFSILVIFTFLGVVAGMAGVLFIPTIAEIMELKFMKRWIKELPKRGNN